MGGPHKHSQISWGPSPHRLSICNISYPLDTVYESAMNTEIDVISTMII